MSSAKPGDDSFLNSLQKDVREVPRIILELAKERIPRRFGFDPVDDIQVLIPMHKGAVGAGNLNVELQKALNPGEGGLVRGNTNCRVNDKVMQIKNNYDKEVYYVLLQRNLIYIAVSRGRKLVVMVGAKKALATGLKNEKIQKRYTYLRYRLGISADVKKGENSG